MAYREAHTNMTYNFQEKTQRNQEEILQILANFSRWEDPFELNRYRKVQEDKEEHELNRIHVEVEFYILANRIETILGEKIFGREKHKENSKGFWEEFKVQENLNPNQYETTSQ